MAQRRTLVHWANAVYEVEIDTVQPSVILRSSLRFPRIPRLESRLSALDRSTEQTLGNSRSPAIHRPPK